MSQRITGHVRKRRWREKETREWHEGSWEYVLELGRAGDSRGLRTIELARVQAGGRVVTSAPKTARGLRTVKLDAATVEVLHAWRREQVRQRIRYAPRWEDAENYVFTHTVRFTDPPRYGVPMQPNWVTKTFAARAAACDLPPLSVHGLRHTWGTTALEAGEHLRAVADHLGHADTAVTDRVYTHTVRSVQDTTALRVAALIAGKRGGGGKHRAADGRQD
jgi:integrase